MTVPTHPPTTASTAEPEQEAAESSQPRVDYARLLQATFDDYDHPRSTSQTSELSSNISQPPTVSKAAEDHVDEAEEGEGVVEHDDKVLLEVQKKWLKDIIHADPVERRWDWRQVRPIDDSLTFSFEDF